MWSKNVIGFSAATLKIGKAVGQRQGHRQGQRHLSGGQLAKYSVSPIQSILFLFVLEWL